MNRRFSAGRPTQLHTARHESHLKGIHRYRNPRSARMPVTMECWLITSRAEVMRLEFGDEPPAEICLPDKPLLEIEDNAVQKAIQDAPYITYRRYHLAHESWRLGIVYSLSPPTVGDIQILSAYRAGHEARPHLV